MICLHQSVVNTSIFPAIATSPPPSYHFLFSFLAAVCFCTSSIIRADGNSSFGGASPSSVTLASGLPGVFYPWNGQLSFSYWTGLVWTHQAVDSSVPKFMSASVLSGTLGSHVIVAYYDDGSKNLKWAWSATANPGHGWFSAIVESGSDQVGSQGVSLAFSETTGRLMVAAGTTRNMILFAVIAATNATKVGSSWTVTEDISGSRLGQSPSIAILQNGKPAVAYKHHTTNERKVYLAVASNTLGDGSWTSTLVDGLFSSYYPSLAVIAGFPHICYYFTTDLKYAVSSSQTGDAGTWTFTNMVGGDFQYVRPRLIESFQKTPMIAMTAYQNNLLKIVFLSNDKSDASGNWDSLVLDEQVPHHQWPSLFLYQGIPTIIYGSDSNSLKWTRSSNVDGSGPWTGSVPGVHDLAVSIPELVADNPDIGTYSFPSLAEVAGFPALVYGRAGGGVVYKVHRDGTWISQNVDVSSTASGGWSTMVLMANGRPGVTYYEGHNDDVRFAAANSDDGTGSWTYRVADGAFVGHYCTAALVDGRPAISYMGRSNPKSLRYAINSQADGKGSWTIRTVSSNIGGSKSMTVLADGRPIIAFVNWVTVSDTVDGLGSWSLATALSAAGSWPDLLVMPGTGFPLVVLVEAGLIKPFLCSDPAVTSSDCWSEHPAIASGSYPSSALIMAGERTAVAYDNSTHVFVAISSFVAGPWSITMISDNGRRPSMASIVGSLSVVFYQDTSLYYVSLEDSLDTVPTSSPMSIQPTPPTSFPTRIPSSAPSPAPTDEFKCVGACAGCSISRLTGTADWCRCCAAMDVSGQFYQQNPCLGTGCSNSIFEFTGCLSSGFCTAPVPGGVMCQAEGFCGLTRAPSQAPTSSPGSSVITIAPVITGTFSFNQAASSFRFSPGNSDLGVLSVFDPYPPKLAQQQGYYTFWRCSRYSGQAAYYFYEDGPFVGSIHWIRPDQLASYSLAYGTMDHADFVEAGNTMIATVSMNPLQLPENVAFFPLLGGCSNSWRIWGDNNLYPVVSGAASVDWSSGFKVRLGGQGNSIYATFHFALSWAAFANGVHPFIHVGFTGPGKFVDVSAGLVSIDVDVSLFTPFDPVFFTSVRASATGDPMVDEMYRLHGGSVWALVNGGSVLRVHLRLWEGSSTNLTAQYLNDLGVELQWMAVLKEFPSAPIPSPASTTIAPTSEPTFSPSIAPTSEPTFSPSIAPTAGPTYSPSIAPTASPTTAPSTMPSVSPTLAPSPYPTIGPSFAPTLSPSFHPMAYPSNPPGPNAVQTTIESRTSSSTASDTFSPYCDSIDTCPELTGLQAGEWQFSSPVERVESLEPIRNCIGGRAGDCFVETSSRRPPDVFFDLQFPGLARIFGIRIRMSSRAGFCGLRVFARGLWGSSFVPIVDLVDQIFPGTALPSSQGHVLCLDGQPASSKPVPFPQDVNGDYVVLTADVNGDSPKSFPNSATTLHFFFGWIPGEVDFTVSFESIAVYGHYVRPGDEQIGTTAQIKVTNVHGRGETVAEPGNSDQGSTAIQFNDEATTIQFNDETTSVEFLSPLPSTSMDIGAIVAICLFSILLITCLVAGFFVWKLKRSRRRRSEPSANQTLGTQELSELQSRPRRSSVSRRREHFGRTARSSRRNESAGTIGTHALADDVSTIGAEDVIAGRPTTSLKTIDTKGLASEEEEIRMHYEPLQLKKKKSSPRKPKQQHYDHVVGPEIQPDDVLIALDRIQRMEQLGEGSFGYVFAGLMDGELPVAVKESKQMNEKERNNLLQEARRMKELPAHRNVIQFYGVCNEVSTVMIVLERAENSLDDLIFEGEHQQSFTMDELKEIVVGICSGVEHLHQHRLVHRDLALRNILLDKEMTVKVSDFGLAREDSSAYQYNYTKSTIGPVKWMAPESITKQRYSVQSDVYSLAVVFYELFSGNGPWLGVSNIEAAGRVGQGEHLEIPLSFPRPVIMAMLRCLEWDAKNRPSVALVKKLLIKGDFSLKLRRDIDDPGVSQAKKDRLWLRMLQNEETGLEQFIATLFVSKRARTETLKLLKDNGIESLEKLVNQKERKLREILTDRTALHYLLKSIDVVEEVKDKGQIIR